MSARTSLDRQTDYITIVPPSYNYFSTETPCSSPEPLLNDDAFAYPEHPLLAYREIQNINCDAPYPSRMASNLMSMQTAAAHSHSASRPRPYSMQNVLHVTSDDSISSDSSKSSMDSATSCLDVARCSRCQRTPSVDIKTGKSNMVAYGLNLWYCSRCASIVGLLVKR